eukprot:GCRY01003991.1.p1 GENE.GCRY01003991.1~~GCRY01003991.1.p1  ORF type:complete len:100 (-),score=0.03 GCRY01003991.1:339-638(-)
MYIESENPNEKNEVAKKASGKQPFRTQGNKTQAINNYCRGGANSPLESTHSLRQQIGLSQNERRKRKTLKNSSNAIELRKKNGKKEKERARAREKRKTE